MPNLEVRERRGARHRAPAGAAAGAADGAAHPLLLGHLRARPGPRPRPLRGGALVQRKRVSDSFSQSKYRTELRKTFSANKLFSILKRKRERGKKRREERGREKKRQHSVLVVVSSC